MKLHFAARWERFFVAVAVLIQKQGAWTMKYVDSSNDADRHEEWPRITWVDDAHFQLVGGSERFASLCRQPYP